MEIAVRYGRADLVVANNVLSEVPDLFDFAAGFAGILRPKGVVAFQFLISCPCCRRSSSTPSAMIATPTCRCSYWSGCCVRSACVYLTSSGCPITAAGTCLCLPRPRAKRGSTLTESHQKRRKLGWPGPPGEL